MKRVLALCVTILFTLTIAYAGGELRYSESFLSDSRGHLTNITTVKSMNEIFPGAMGDIPGFGLRDSKARTGEIRYQVQGARRLEIGFYSYHSAYAFRNGDSWMNGMPSSTYVGDSWPVYMDPQGALYMRDGDIWYQLRSTGHGELFYPIDKAPSSIKPLNLEILSMDNSGKIKELIGKTQSFRPLMTSYNKQIYGYYEKRIYEIPNESQELIISLNYPWEMRDAGGKPIPSFLINYPVVVNELVLEGNNLLFDQPPVAPEKPSVPETGSSGSSSSGGGSGSHTGDGAHRPNDEIILPDNQAEDTWIDRTEIPPELAEEPSQEMPVSSSAAGSREQKSSSSKKSKTDKKPDQKPEAEVERGPSEPEQETVIYQMERETARDRLFSLMLAGYGLIGLGAAALLYRHIKRKK